jgi:hypothetical protein
MKRKSEFGEVTKGILVPCIMLSKIYPATFTFDCSARYSNEKERQVELG